MGTKSPGDLEFPPGLKSYPRCYRHSDGLRLRKKAPAVFWPSRLPGPTICTRVIGMLDGLAKIKPPADHECGLEQPAAFVVPGQCTQLVAVGNGEKENRRRFGG
jgi:hypothetical protein